MPFAPGSPKVAKPVELARAVFFRRGWSYRAAAPVLGCCYQHIACVLNGRKSSAPLLARIAALPTRKRSRRSAKTTTHTNPR